LGRVLRIPGWTKIIDLIEKPSDDTVGRDIKAYRKIRKLLRHACGLAGVNDIRPHQFRHAISEAARARDLPMAEHQKLLGHRDFETTNRYYIHASAEAQVAVVNDAISSIRKAATGKVR
jgi:integrase